MQVGCALEHQLAPDGDVLTSWVVSCDTLSNVRSLRSLEDDSQLGECHFDGVILLCLFCHHIFTFFGI